MVRSGRGPWIVFLTHAWSFPFSKAFNRRSVAFRHPDFPQVVLFPAANPTKKSWRLHGPRLKAWTWRLSTIGRRRPFPLRDVDNDDDPVAQMEIDPLLSSSPLTSRFTSRLTEPEHGTKLQRPTPASPFSPGFGHIPSIYRPSFSWCHYATYAYCSWSRNEGLSDHCGYQGQGLRGGAIKPRNFSLFRVQGWIIG